jgi:hypothetical protein
LSVFLVLFLYFPHYASFFFCPFLYIPSVSQPALSCVQGLSTRAFFVCVVTTSCGLAGMYQRFGEPYCLHVRSACESTRRYNP